MGDVKSFPWSSCSTSLISSWTEEVPEVICRPSLTILIPKTKNNIAASIIVYRRGTTINTSPRSHHTDSVFAGRYLNVALHGQGQRSKQSLLVEKRRQR